MKSETQPLGTYIDAIQATVAEWVALCPILGVFDREIGCEGEGGSGSRGGGKCRLESR